MKFKKKSSPLKPLNQIKPNLAGWDPFKIVSDSPALHLWLLLLKIEIIWILSFRENLNVIIYQNMPNLHNWYKSAERNISQNNPKFKLNYSYPCGCC
jgi:hypothetical protein